MKTDAKIDMLHKSGLFGKGTASRARKSGISEDTEDEEEVELSMSVVRDNSNVY